MGINGIGHTSFLVKVDLKWVLDLGSSLHEGFQPTH